MPPTKMSPERRRLLDLLLTEQGVEPARPRIERFPGDRTAMPLSLMQQRIWFFDRLQPMSTIYNVAGAVRMRGQVDVAALHAALGEVVRRHEVLRTTFRQSAGRAVQQVNPPGEFELPLEDLRHLPPQERATAAEEYCRTEVSRPFDLENDLMLRPRLLRTGDEDHLLVLIQHHIATDGWSVNLLLKEVGELYRAFSRGAATPLPELEVQYGDFAAWQRDRLSGDVLTGKVAYWKENLAGAGLLDLPWIGRARPAALSWDGDALSFRLTPELCTRIRALADSERATPYMVLLAALSVVLTRWSGGDEAIVGCPIANRAHSDLERVMGCFVNTLPLRVDTSGDPSFRELLRTAREVCHGGYEHQEVPFELMVEAVNPERDASSHVPLIRHQLGLHNEPHWSVDLDGVVFEIETLSTGTVRFDMEIDLAVDPDGGISGPVYFSTDLFTREVVERVLASFTLVLNAAVAGPDTRIAVLPLAEEAPAGHTGASQATPAGSVPEVFERVATARPDAEALVCGETRWTYRELDERAGRLAAHLRGLGAGPGSRVAVLLPPSPELAAAVLAALKAGAEAVPLDPGHARPLVRAALRDLAASVVLTASGSWHPGLLGASSDVQVLFLDRIADDLATQPASPPGPGGSDRNIALVLCAEDGTATPNSHTAVLDRARWGRDLVAGGTFGLCGPVTLDTAPWRWLPALLTGARLVLDPAQETGQATAELLVRERVDVVHLVPAALAGLAAAPAFATGPAPREIVVVAEEPWPALVAEIRRIAPETKLVELRGSAFTAADRVVVERPGGGEPVCTDPAVVVLDGNAQAVPLGVPGELYVFDLTGESGPRRTGERGRRLPDGMIAPLGRVLRMRRKGVESAEVEASLMLHEDVDRAVVVADDEAPGGTELLGYLTLRDRGGVVRDDAPEVVKRARWRKVFEETYFGRGAEDDPTVNTAGWKSRSTGEYLAPEEMREWADLTMRRITATRPSRVLEVGCRNGQLLFRLAMRCDSYVATDLSSRALAHIKEHEQWLATKAETVRLLERPTDDFGGFADGEFDTVVINSLAQYFAEPDYLARVLTDAVRVVRPGGTVYVGDVRSLALLEALHLFVHMRRLPPGTPVALLRQLVAQRVEREEDLVLEPASFRAITAKIAGVAGVDLLPRLGRHRNELTAFRYDVLIHVGEPGQAPPQVPARDWVTDGGTLADLRAELTAGPVPALVLQGVPDARTATEVAAAQLLDSGLVDTAGDLAEAARPMLGEPGAPVDHAEILALAAELGYRALIGCSADGVPGNLDVVLRREGEAESLTPQQVSAVLAAQWPAVPEETRTNDPLRAMRIKAVVPEVRAAVQGRHPGHAVPAELVVLREWPLGADGTVDLTRLPPPDRSAREAAKVSREPGTETERVIAEIWADALGLDRIGVSEDFFALGGHSLMGAEVVERVRTVYDVELPLGTLFESPTVASVAEYIDERLAGSGKSSAAAVPILRVDRDSYRRKRELAAAGRGHRPAGA
ncbi:condensation domain-containing protein [Amycolatopsis sp. NPDC005232]|uniref:condensation domain-containing protein n=1 Tax=Amycolatopsis sp. NPDC005232 TaxID=3157027 RepID=UPI0033BEE794